MNVPGAGVTEIADDFVYSEGLKPRHNVAEIISKSFPSLQLLDMSVVDISFLSRSTKW